MHGAQRRKANEAAVFRTKGCKDVVAKNPGMKVTKEQSGNWQRDKGLAIMENWIQSGEQIDVVCANNDEMALGAIQALKDAARQAGHEPQIMYMRPVYIEDDPAVARRSP